jgi:hypothetical protein
MKWLANKPLISIHWKNRSNFAQGDVADLPSTLEHDKPNEMKRSNSWKKKLIKTEAKNFANKSVSTKSQQTRTFELERETKKSNYNFFFCVIKLKFISNF